MRRLPKQDLPDFSAIFKAEVDLPPYLNEWKKSISSLSTNAGELNEKLH
jgi:hypothetical protein